MTNSTTKLDEKQHYSGMTEDILNGTKWNKVKQDTGFIERVSLAICRKRLIKECHLSLYKHELPLIAIVNDDNLKHWPDYLKIVEIASRGIYIGVEYGYDGKCLSVITRWIGNELPIDLISMVIHYYMELEIKSFILEPMRFMDIAGASFQDMRKYNKWVASIYIRDFVQEIKEIAHNYSIDFNLMKTCFDAHGVDYSYLESHSRKDFTELLREYGISAGAATKVFRILYQKKEVEILK